MTTVQFEGLSQILHPLPDKKAAAVDSPEPASNPTMAVKRKMERVRTCVLKLRPTTRGELVKVIRNVHQGLPVSEKEVDPFIKILERDGLIEIADTGAVSYPEEPTEKTG